MFCLSKHPEYVQRIQAEVDEVVGDGKPTFENLKSLAFTMRVINESMRLYPQPPVLIRRALEEDELAGYHIPKGSDFFISVWNLHRSPKYWDKPEEFNPDRFPISESVPNEVTQDYAYLPFGAGRRKCIGDQFALFESVIILAMLFRRFDFKMDKNAPAVGMTTGATIHTSDGLYMNVSPRSMPELMKKADEADRPALKIPQEAVKVA
ncbi:hypothetical protein WJX84_002516 [Apatococcus fuscideae]|uniref:Cytochrome P450 n=1 Tax=Apatococcus fuscideae TaxID=2026836 RepID=A0AAW1T651_9CHLO